MSHSVQVLICACLLSTAFSGCRSLRQSANELNLAAARDLTFHGMNALQHGRPDQAQNLLRQATEACPDDLRIRQHLASALVQQGKVDEAIKELESAIGSSCSDLRLHVELGNLYLLKQRPRTARQHAEVAINMNRRAPLAWELLGRCEDASGDWDAALSSFHRASALEGANPDVQIEIAKVYRKMQRPIQALTALEIYNEGFASDQVPMESVLLTARTFGDLKQYRRATEYLASATARDDASPDVWLALSHFQSTMGDPSAALMTARTAQNVFPDDVQLSQWSQDLDQRIRNPERTAALPRFGSR